MPVISFFNHFQEGIFHFGHGILGFSNFDHNFLVLAFDLIDGFFD